MDRRHGLGIDGAGEANADGGRSDAHQRLATAMDACGFASGGRR